MMKRSNFTQRFLLLSSVLLGLHLSGQAAEQETVQEAYGYSISTNYGIVKFDLSSFVPSMLYSQENKIGAGAFAEGRYYVMQADEDGNPVGLFEYNLKTGESRQVNDMSGAPSIFMDMTYDYTTSTLYAIADDWPETALMSISLPSGELTYHYNIETSLFTLAADVNGDLYSMGKDGTMYRIDKATGSLTTVGGDNSLYLNGLQSMDFDLNTGKLYWLTTSYGRCTLEEIDTDTWKTVNVFGTVNEQISGLYTGYTDAEPESPGAPADFVAVPGDNGDSYCTLNWTNPVRTFNRNDLNSIDEVTVYRDGKEIYSRSGVGVGENMQYVDDNVPAGLYTYKVTASNHAGEGMFSIYKVFVGEDTPSAPTDVTAVVENATTIHISWKAPATGVNGGWISPDLSYRVTRVNDGKVLVEDLKETTYTDVIEGAYGAYSYTVTAYSSVGESEAATSNIVGAGEASGLPFSCAFSSQGELDTWYVYNEDGNEKCWVANNGLSGNIGAETYFEKGIDSDDWLISPSVKLTAGNVTEVSFMVYTAYYPTEKIEIRLGKGNKPEDQTLYVKELDVRSYYGTQIKEMLPAVEEDGEYNLSIRYVSPGDTYSGWGVHISDLVWREQNEGSVSGVVMSGDTPLYNAVVTVGDYTTKTNYQGVYELPEVKQGEYTATASLLGYEDGSRQISVSIGENTVCDFNLAALAKYTVSGKITDAKGSPIAGAQVILSGYNGYTSTTGSDGTYRIDGVFAHDDYQLTVRKNNFRSVTEDFAVRDNREADYSLHYDNLPPYVVKAEDMKGSVQVSWVSPKSLTERYYDNGFPESSMGYDGGTEYHVVGTIYREPSTVYEVKWQTMYFEGKSNKVNIYIFDLNYGGEPTSDMLFKAEGIETVDGQWNTYRLPSAVEAPKGFLVAISGEGNVALACDGGTPDGEVAHPMTQCYNTDYTFERGYRYVDETSRPSRCFFLRAVCENYEEEGSTAAEISYNVWRVPTEGGAAMDETSWIQIGERLDDTQITDSDLLSGRYQYAVKAYYPVEDLLSEPVLSDTLEFNMDATLTVNVTANSDNAHANGALVVLSNESRTYQATVSDNKAVFEKIAKDVYRLRVTHKGFEAINASQIKIQGEETDFSLDCELEQSLDLARNIDILPTEKNDEWRLVWNVQENINDDFDGDDYEDFVINPSGNVGWQYIDNDNLATYGFGNTTFPNMRERMAAISFNSYTTTPPLGLPTAHSGERCLAFFAARATETEAGDIVLHDSDDYLISPLLAPYKDYKFSFYARSYEESQGYLERIRVGYSTTTPDLDQFVWIDEDYYYVPVDYQQYTYDIPQEAKYVVLNSHSISNFILLVDDIFIGVEGQTTGNSYMPVNVEKYKVYLDGEFKFETREKECMLSDLEVGEHKAGIVQVFATGESEMLEIDFEVLESGVVQNHVNDLHVYAHDGQLYIVGEYDSAVLYTSDGVSVMRIEGVQSTDVSSLQNGIYMLRAVTEDGRVAVYKVALK